MTKPFEYPDTPIDRGKILWEEDLEKFLAEKGQWGRFQDVDGDGIPYRTLPGNRHARGAYFSRGTGHDEFARYSEDPEVWERNMKRLVKKFETAKQYIPKPEIKTMEGAEIGIIAFGSTEAAIEEARIQLAQRGVATDFLRLRAIPFNDEVEEFLRSHERIYVMEINRDGQLAQLLMLNLPQLAHKLRPAPHLDGMPLSARWIRDEILSREEK
jgi:2-oxoglutarate/2-oxoacid ferredoxin oxidoreductase subunit alpha